MVVDVDEVELVDVLELELLVVARWVVVVLARWVEVVVDAWVVVVVGAAVVDGVGSVVVVVVGSVVVGGEVVGGVCAAAVPRPNANMPTITATTPAQSAANAARRGAETRDTPSTLDRRPQRFCALRTPTWPGSTAKSALMKRTGIGRATTDRPAQ